MNSRNFLSFFVILAFMVFAYYFPKAVASIFGLSALSFGGAVSIQFDEFTQAMISIAIFAFLYFFTKRRGGIKIGNVRIRL